MKASFIIPAYNEELNIPIVSKAVKDIMEQISHDYELLFINDGSRDNTFQAIEKEVKENPKVKAIHFSRNFGKEAATSAGLHHAEGDFAIIMDSDMQHPVELIPQFIQKYSEGYDVVVGKINISKSSLHKRVLRKVFYKTLSAMNDHDVDVSGNDFRLLDRQVIDAFKTFDEGNRATRTLIDWLGFSRTYIYFTPNERENGEASYTTRKLVKLAMNAFVSNSLMPLKVAGYVGSIVFAVSGTLGLFMIVEKYILGDPMGFKFSPVSQLAVFNVFLVSFVLLCLGFMAMYIGNIHHEVRRRPLYIIRKNRKIILKNSIDKNINTNNTNANHK